VIRRTLRRAFLDELPLKIVSMVIAVTLFAIVRSERDAATGVNVKVIYTLPSDRVLVSEPASEVRVAVRGSWTRLQRLDDRALEPLRVDLQRRGDGVFQFEDGMVKLPPGLRVVSITPPEVMLRFEPRASRDVPIEPVLGGQPAEGFRVGKLRVEPERVRVDGARSEVEALTRVRTRPVPIAGARAPVEAQVTLENEPRHAHFVDVERVTVKVEVKPALAEREVGAIPIKIVGLSRLDGTIEPSEARLILRGPAEVVRELSVDGIALTVDAQAADLRSPGRVTRPITVTGLPVGVAAEIQPDSVTLTTRRRRE
jgi:YbbR domain-containing protein